MRPFSSRTIDLGWLVGSVGGGSNPEKARVFRFSDPCEPFVSFDSSVDRVSRDDVGTVQGSRPTARTPNKATVNYPFRAPRSHSGNVNAERARGRVRTDRMW